ncbi:MAG: DUF420 domain-containing protein [Halobacteriales archaeon]
MADLVDGSLPLDARRTTAAVTALAYLVVVATFAGWLPFPELSRATIDGLSHATALANAGTVVAILVGWHAIRTGRIRRHAASMVTAILLIGAFLVMYLTRIGGGGEKEIVGAEGLVYTAYLVMLGVHVLLSILAVPLVVYVLLLALTRPVEAIYDSGHARLGRITATTWLLSLVLGIVTYLLLNHVYGARLAG